ncbi:Uncharacterized protein HZ326_27608 [Fusarium oxysporum f. sp. albedinis]|nr:Uncharacterized protein HZ326_27608 [Fusarium oxysporum f. sp. albedinis]
MRFLYLSLLGATRLSAGEAAVEAFVRHDLTMVTAGLGKRASFIILVSTSTTGAKHLPGCRKTRSRMNTRERWWSLSKTDKAGKTAKSKFRGIAITS